MSSYSSVPDDSHKAPRGIPFIIANEAAERFSYYGMRTILVVFMTKYMMDSSGAKDLMSPEEAKAYFHLFNSGVYLFPLLGAILADWLLGKYRTILWLSIVYCLGHLALAIDETRLGLGIGLTLIAIGSGGIKPCVSAHVGDQFGKNNKHLMDKVFSWFYLSINVGAFLSTLSTPLLLEYYGPHLAFGVPGALMLLATWLFYAGRKTFIHVPASGNQFFKETFSVDGMKIILRLAVIYCFVAMFWALYDQTASAWVLQADNMDRYFMGIEWLPSQIQAVNPILILTLTPLVTYGLYPFLRTIIPLGYLTRMGIGFFLTVAAFLISALIESWITAGQTPSIAWQLLAYLVITLAEVFVSITCLEFSYAQAPKSMKSFIMSLYLVSVALGNLFVMAVNFFIQNEDGTSKLAGADYYLFFAGTMFVASVLFIAVAKWYNSEGPKSKPQGGIKGEALAIENA
ncbi:POT family MFS transporter [Pseudobacteriovorax antillogorgiicola]|uniref:Proton-dependent oligopeptide transporter, POT family n=1 Tax=Pseudobacteriovorax antillogorgiicola TaxID=1513793 RepID=A0A1Y6CQL7_9BACT|nr:POT family MFS transporter [Pseudobacteriovorax antillogorgiicola]TCS46383.1 POT family proton-dependent oligopeptide transporter [Pseudobacteriovorax antillogorgiicola]SMF68647.1 proton-dependent oligopeptide transporter, POT family [Pseudobacteriovorax antillogorgiicola]